MNRPLLLFALNGFVAVGLGAFGAHALEASVSPDRLATWQTAVHYQMFHSLGLLACAWLEAVLGRVTLLRWSARLFLAGLLLFCGSKAGSKRGARVEYRGAREADGREHVRKGGSVVLSGI